jgi:hypothetical protein
VISIKCIVIWDEELVTGNPVPFYLID